MKQLTCAADDCQVRFDPYSIDQVYCSPKCAVRMRVRRLRARRKNGPDGGGGGKQRRLFPKVSVSAKRVKPPRPETAPLFAMIPNGRHEKHAPILQTGIDVVPVIRPCEDADSQALLTKKLPASIPATAFDQEAA